MDGDPRKLWIRDRTLAMTGVHNHRLFQEMILANNGAVDDQLYKFLNENIPQTEYDNRLFIVFKTYYDKIVDEKIIVRQLGKAIFLDQLSSPSTERRGLVEG